MGAFIALYICTFQISSEFCMWLRNLPAGEDPTVNSLPQEYVRALFDTESQRGLPTEVDI